MTKAELRVWGGCVMRRGGQVRAIVATTSQKEAARIAGVALHELRNYWSTTRNDVELKTALSAPGTLFLSSGLHDNDFRPERKAG